MRFYGTLNENVYNDKQFEETLLYYWGGDFSINSGVGGDIYANENYFRANVLIEDITFNLKEDGLIDIYLINEDRSNAKLFFSIDGKKGIGKYEVGKIIPKNCTLGFLGNILTASPNKYGYKLVTYGKDLKFKDVSSTIKVSINVEMSYRYIIKDENKDKIFDRFFQEQHSTTTYIGNGIGLHIVKEYVTMHHGTITVENHIPQGTIFTITLPVTHNYAVNDEKQDEAEIREKAVDEVSDTTDTHKTSLLIVEDNDDFRNFLINCLKGTYQVFDAPNGKEALEILAHQSIQIVISDVMMPEMDGMELCRKIKTDIRYSHIPVILLTARTADEHELSGLKEGADDYITKPFNLEILLLRIQKILKWTKNNHEKFKTIDISPSEITVSSLDEQLIEKAIRAVEENMDNSEFSVEELSSYVGMSRGHLYKKLIMITGKSPLEFIRILRVKRGKQLLEQSQLNVSQIAYQIGLSPKQFAKYFKEEFGYVPSEYIKNNNTN